MRRIQSPPSGLMHLLRSPENIEMCMRANDPEPEGKYLHWDELRRRNPPTGMSHEQWWLAVALARSAQYKPLPLMTSSGQPFKLGQPDSVQYLCHQIDRDASGHLQVPEPIIDSGTRDRYLVSSLIEEAITSSQLEGASTTKQVAKEMIRTGRHPRNRSEQMILNNYHAMESIRDRAREPLSPAMILELHRMVTLDTLDDPGAAGRFRRADEDIKVVEPRDGEIVHVPPHAGSLEQRMQALCDFANAKASRPFVHPVVRAIMIHFWLAYDHPFVDGNGRTARALFYWGMLANGYWLAEFISLSSAIKKARAQYDRAFLYSESAGDGFTDYDATYFVVQQLRAIRTAIDSLFAYLRRKVDEVHTVERQLQTRDDLNHRQLALLAHALRHPSTEYTIEQHRNSHRVVYQTARTDLLGLEAKGLLERRRRGKKFYFVPVAGLETIIGG